MQRGVKARRVVPLGLSDATDGSGAFPGAMSQLVNLIPHPNTRGEMVPRPAMAVQHAIPDWGGGPVTALTPVGSTLYGMVASAAFPGKDEPFVYNADSNTFITIGGLTAAQLPTSQPTTGKWTPPTIARVGGRVIFTHPGFAGGNTVATLGCQFLANPVLGSTTLNIGQGVAANLKVGAKLSGASIAPGATVTALAEVSIATAGTGTTGALTFTVTSAAGLFRGMTISAPGLYAQIVNISGLTITSNVALGQNFTGATVTFNGIAATMSLPATGTATEVDAATSTTAIKFGWLDVSGYTTSITGNVNSSPLVTGNFGIAGIAPGMSVTGTGIVGGTTVVQAQAVTFTAYGATIATQQTIYLTDGLTASSIDVGQAVSGPGIPVGAVVVSVNPPAGTVDISQAATATAQSQPFVFSGAMIVLSQGGTRTINANLTISGGTPTAPVWGAGDLNGIPIASTTPPVCVAQMGNRAWFGVNTATTAGVQASDAGDPGTQTNASQSLLFGYPAPVTAMAGLPLMNQLGGIIQSLMVFQGDMNIQQITGDFALGTIALNTLQVATGTLAPNSLASTPRGLLFAATDGLRLIDFEANVSDPIGDHGEGLRIPFVNATTPSRIAAAYNENVYRITITWQPPQTAVRVWGSAVRTDEFWFHFSRERASPDKGPTTHWTGPHTSIQDLIAPWEGASSFVAAPQAGRGSLYRSDPYPIFTTSYVEFGQQLQCSMQTMLLPDNPEGMANATFESTIWLNLLSGSETVLATATDDLGQVLDQTYVWIGAVSLAAHRLIPWHVPLVYRQMMLAVAAGAHPFLELGAIVLREKSLGYQLPYPPPAEFILNMGVLGGSDALA